ncbi:SusC/RagA family TonB-linked outer membrane protein [Pedobacter kyonggii]|uniref:TonB-dependent receptor n=1 Tax=Pedobacter kyonggii TaxID=1926871 RepID=A0A4Q9HF80_9SPHI|nr:TonB-dependent receptor [Pedobacter kyonggii]TBO43604.1 TonB-dependent receptor [Pedobacter kyonggii]
MRKLLFIIFISLISINTFAQLRTITGKVVDEQNKPLPGVVVKAGKANTGAATNLQGNYTLSVADTTKTLTFSFLSYMPQTVSINGKSVINVTLKESITELEEVVAIGYGTQTKANLTGAVSSVSVKEVEGRALTSADQILQGKLSGVTIVQNSGRPGDDNSEIRIRGVSSIDNNNDPLVIINGVQGNINDVNPNDIESMSVLKDAASAAIYGSRASAGVIIIETKKGFTGKGLQVEYNVTGSMVDATRLPETVDSYTYASLLNEARVNVALAPIYNQTQLDLFKSGTDPNYPNTNWYDVYYKKAYMQNHYVSLRGGGKNYKFSNSVGYKDQQGILVGTSSKRLSFNSSLSGSFVKNKVRVNLGLVGYNEKGKELISPTSTVLAEISGSLPTAFVQSIDTLTGNANLYSYPGRFLGAMDLGGGIENKQNSLNSRASVEIEPIKGLIGKVLLSNNKFKTDYVNFTPRFYTSGTYEETSINLRESSLEKRNSESNLNTFLASLEYTLKKGKHEAKFLAAHERLEMIYNYDMGSVKNLSSNQPIFNYGDPTSPFLSSAANETATASLFGRFNYSYAGKYLLELNMRRDGSSRFADGRKWGNFPSVSAGWRISEEGFFKGIKKDVYLKLRGSWGKLGNQNIFTQYAFADQMSGSEYYAFGNAIVPGRGTIILANKDTRWETTEQFDAGFDMILWNRLSITADYFNKKTYDILARVTIPPSLGVTVLPYQNIGDMVNKGIEMSIGYNSPVNNKKINYGFTVNASYITNKLTSLGGLPYVDHSVTNRSVVGEPFSSFYGYKVDGIYQVSDFTWQNGSDPSVPHASRTYVLKPGMPNVSGVMSNPAPGDIKISDVKSDGVINADDKTLIGNPIPKLQYSLSANVSYKNFGLNVIAQGTGRTDAYMNGNLIGPFFNTTGPLLTSTVTDRWTIDNPSDKYQRIYVDKGRDALITSYNIYNAAYFRLKSLQLSYTFNAAFTRKIDVSRCRVFVSGENLFLISDFPKGFDPERRSTNVTAAFHPQVATYSIGLNLNF